MWGFGWVMWDHRRLKMDDGGSPASTAGVGASSGAVHASGGLKQMRQSPRAEFSKLGLKPSFLCIFLPMLFFLHCYLIYLWPKEVIFENDNFSTEVELFWCVRVHQTAYVQLLSFGLINKIRQVLKNLRPNIKKVLREHQDFKSCDAPTKTIETQHLSLSTSGPSLPCGEFPSGTAWPALRCQMRPPQLETCDKFGTPLMRLVGLIMMRDKSHFGLWQTVLTKSRRQTPLTELGSGEVSRHVKKYLLQEQRRLKPHDREVRKIGTVADWNHESIFQFVPVGPELFRACHIFGLIIVNTQSFARLSPINTHLRETDVLALFCECAKVSTLYGTHACLSCIGYGPGCEVTHVAGLLFIHSNRYSPGTFPSLRFEALINSRLEAANFSSACRACVEVFEAEAGVGQGVHIPCQSPATSEVSSSPAGTTGQAINPKFGFPLSSQPS
ncbi:uncharacterized protein PGTG_11102 [Puccinia graminis f. sp. tritici CRL 75-36-700-3]|uniref:Uncharacterized protein n=1 Tax=Puccinia graminis f. sp. tritici (strain CRL 75-36-700-3 / race SCCL) TaxID=418459 RepID=E3KND7_PUCGT|nr:uncharacterized protein PGTG_11102 [Puccinia graminis f. sp. tritici CRL 75-36-700-3]EFP85773.1 hypothetical protein PGTG_11102 [Puccinia graminis f. sp. tritici CRL 75-36-700-3]